MTRALNDIMAFDQVVYVDEHGNVTEAGYDAPEMVYVELDDDGQMVGSDSRDGLDVLVDTHLDGWKPMQGHCGAYGESSESFIQHPSEFIGGGLARAILEQPGHYVAVLVDGMAPDGYDDDTTVGWTVLYREAR